MGAEPQPAPARAANEEPDGATSAQAQPLGRERLLQSGEVLEGRFVIQKHLGSGGMGDVYEAEDLWLSGARVALKTMRPEFSANSDARQRFRHEVLLSRSITHPNVCPVYEIFSCPGRTPELWFFTMKLLSGVTLEARLRDGPMQTRDALKIAQELAAGLQAIHDLGIVHRDLKPSNVFLERFAGHERAVVTDFGLARTLSLDPYATVEGGQVVGTPGYLAPEVRRGESATPRSDIYAFGIVVHELLFGHRPDSLVTLPVEPAAGDVTARRFRSMIFRCIAQNPEERFTSAKEAIEHLDDAVGIRPISRRTILLSGAATLCAGGTALWFQRDELGRLLSPLPTPRRVAILPAADPHASTEDASLLGGILETVSTQLARTEKFETDLFIVPPRSLHQRDAATVAQALGLFGANLLLSGSLRRAEGSVTLGLRLVETGTGKLLRRAEIAAPFASLYVLAGLVAYRAAALLGIRRNHLNAQQQVPPETTNPDAYAAYERGRGALRGYGLPATDQAIAELQKAVDLDPHFAGAWASLSDAYCTRFHLMKDPAALELGERTSAKAKDLAPDLPAAYASRARVELYRGRYDDAIRDAQKATMLDPDNSDARAALAETYVRSGKFALAEETYRKLSADRPNDWLVLNDWGDLCIDQADYAKAEKLLREATMVAPQAALPWRNLGAVYLATGKLQEANSALNRSIAVLPTGEAYTNLGTALFWLGKYRQAAEAYVKATGLNPQNALLWRNLGDAYQMLGGMNEKARAAWRRAANLTAGMLDLNPNNVDAQVSLALYRAKLGESTQALALLHRIDGLPGRTVEQLFYEAQAYELAGKRDTALQILRECVKLGYSPSDILHAPELAGLRNDLRFKDLGLGVAAK